MQDSGELRRESDFVMPGLDPGIRHYSKEMDHRVKPGDDDPGTVSSTGCLKIEPETS